MQHALITAGATEEPIDDVRFISNFSSGRTPKMFAHACVERGVDEVTVLAGRRCARQHDWRDDVEVVPFQTTADLRDTLETYLHKRGAPDLLMMGAAVSDYRPVERTDGKLDSEVETRTIELERTDKILADLREACGVETFLVGFKLTVGDDLETRRRKGFEQVKDNRLDLTIVNDKTDLEGDRHPVHLATPEYDKGLIEVPASDRAEMVEQVMDLIERRYHVTWSSTHEQAPRYTHEDLEHPDRLKHLLSSVINRWSMLPDRSGNVSMRDGDEHVLITPRQVLKWKVEPEDMRRVSCRLGVDDHDVYFQRHHEAPAGGPPSSIDTSVHRRLYNRLVEIEAMIHTHPNHLAVWEPSSVTSFPYPCGVQEEADALIEALETSSGDHVRFAVLQHHGFLTAIYDYPHWASRSHTIRQAWCNHLQAIEATDFPFKAVRPVLADGWPVGVTAHWPDDRCPEGLVDRPVVSLYLHEDARGEGLGRRLAARMARWGWSVAVGERCEVRDFYADRGWSVTSRCAIGTDRTWFEDLTDRPGETLSDAGHEIWIMTPPEGTRSFPLSEADLTQTDDPLNLCE